MQNQNELAQFDKLKADISLFVEPVFQVAVVDQESADKALALARDVKLWSKKVEERRKLLVSPLNEQVKRVNEYAKEITKPLVEAEVHVKNQLKAFEEQLEIKRQEERRKAEEERKRLEAEAQAKLKAEQEEAEMMAMFMPKTDLEKKRDEIVKQVESQRVQAEIADAHKSNIQKIESMKVSGARKIWKCRIRCMEEVPIEYMTVNESKIMKDFHAGVKEIPGVQFYQETSVAIR